MSSLQALVLVLCTSWCLLEETSAWNKDSCGAANLTLKEIDAENQEIKVEWKGFKGDHNGITYIFGCTIFEGMWSIYEPFSCGNSNVVDKLQTQEDSYRYQLANQNYFCAVDGGPHFQMSNMITVKTPGYSTSNLLKIVLPILTVFVVIFIIIVVCYCRKRKKPVVGLVMRDQNPSQPISTASQNHFTL